MKRAQVFETIAVADKELICSLAGEVSKDSNIRVLREQIGMIMARARDSVEGIPFNLGEVLVTEAEVSVNGTLGYSMILGMDQDHARAGAILDAAEEAGHILRERIINALSEERQKAEARGCRLWSALKATKVDFEVMS